uniref:Nucleoporin Nup54 alpha-helical domain-containing protein n=1 Tax=Odontella aurita TaxID=265563 RepID=A0A7S4J9M0_9STRA|mmetsp:Transcript_42123/g.127806  ORF Transcript_42123/g.127806 Transcript_42123/m.127806 type:complete len:569 (+) Transcript_42123:245-1951(+)
MAFSFGTPAPAAAPGAPAPAGGGFSFGAAPAAPAPGAARPVSGGGFSFGGTAAPAAPASAGGGLFGSTPAPAAFGSAPAAPATFPTAPAATPQQPISAHTSYSQLPDNAKRALDAVHDLMTRHRRTMMGLQSMAPALLLTPETTVGGIVTAADAAAGPPSPALGSKTSGGDPDKTPLPRQISDLRSRVSSLAGRVDRSLSDASYLRAESERLCQGAIMHAAWPIEAVAVRRGVLLRQPSHTSGEARRGVEGALGHLLDVQASAVDRIELMPSPYLWETIRELQERLEAVRLEVDALSDRLSVAERSHEEGALLALPGGGAGRGVVGFGPRDTSAERIASVVRAQSDAFVRVAAAAARAHDDLERLRARYRRAASAAGYAGDDPFARADAREAEEERRGQDQIRSGVASAAAAGVTAAQTTQPSALASTGAFGAPAPAPPPAGGLFGTPAPAPATGGLFGSASAPAPAPGGGLFGSTTPAPAPTGGGLFGASTPAPAAGGGLFGSTTPAAPAPAAGAGLFGAAPTAPAPSAGGFGFSATPAPGTAAAPATTFGNPPARSKSKSRSGRRR